MQQYARTHGNRMCFEHVALAGFGRMDCTHVHGVRELLAACACLHVVQHQAGSQREAAVQVLDEGLPSPPKMTADKVERRRAVCVQKANSGARAEQRTATHPPPAIASSGLLPSGLDASSIRILSGPDETTPASGRPGRPARMAPPTAPCFPSREMPLAMELRRYWVSALCSRTVSSAHTSSCAHNQRTNASPTVMRDGVPMRSRSNAERMRSSR